MKPRIFIDDVPREKAPLIDVKGIERIEAVSCELLAKEQIDRFTWDDPADYDDESEYPYQYQLWHVDYELKNPHAQGGGPHYVIDAEIGTIRSKKYEQ